MQIPAHPFLQTLLDIAGGPCYLVGGSVRDLLAGGTDLKDIDIVMPARSEAVARAFADAIGGSFFVLDEDRRITRVVKRDEAGTLQFDFANFEGPDLQADLARRDFTMNAMAIGLRELLAGASLDSVIDLFGGREDVRQRLVRVPDPKVLDDDPLRLLRAARFAAALGFSIEMGTTAHIRSRSDLVTKPSAERIRDELFQILSLPGAGRHMLLLESLGLLRRLLPELTPLRDFSPGKHHLYDIFTHSIKTAEYADAAAAALPVLSPAHAGTITAHLDESLEQSVTRRAALRFACLLHDCAKAETYSRGDDGDIHFFGHDQIGADNAKAVCERFRLSKDAASVVVRLIRHHMRPLHLSAPGGPSRKALFRYCRDLKDAVPESIVLSLADAKATAEVMPVEGFTSTERTSSAILDYYYGTYLKAEAAPFVTGRDLIERGMKPGPAFRGILDEIREKQADGSLADRQDALLYLERMRSQPS